MLCVDAIRDQVGGTPLLSSSVPPWSLGQYLGSEQPSDRIVAGCREGRSILGGTSTGRRAQSGGSGNYVDRASGHISPSDSEVWEGARVRTEYHVCRPREGFQLAPQNPYFSDSLLNGLGPGDSPPPTLVSSHTHIPEHPWHQKSFHSFYSMQTSLHSQIPDLWIPLPSSLLF